MQEPQRSDRPEKSTADKVLPWIAGTLGVGIAMVIVWASIWRPDPWYSMGAVFLLGLVGVTGAAFARKPRQ